MLTRLVRPWRENCCHNDVTKKIPPRFRFLTVFSPVTNRPLDPSTCLPAPQPTDIDPTAVKGEEFWLKYIFKLCTPPDHVNNSIALSIKYLCKMTKKLEELLDENCQWVL